MKNVSKKVILLALLAVAVAVFFVFIQPWAQSRKTAKTNDESKPSSPSIVWTPDHLNMDGDDTVTVTLTAQSAIPATEVEMVPALSPYLSVSPQSLPALSKGATQTLQIAAKVPAGTPMDTIDGTLHVRLGSSTIARPLPIVLNTWPEVSVGEVSFHYPPGMHLVEGTNSVVLLPYAPPDESQAADGYGISVSFDKNPAGLPIQQYYDGDPGSDLFGKSAIPTELQIAGRRALRFEPWISEGGTVVIIMPLNSDFLTIVDVGGTLEESGQLETLLHSLTLEEGM